VVAEDIRGLTVAEVSCGRGGGAAFIARERAPAELTGIDISAQNIALAERHFAGPPGIRFRQGAAEHLPLEDASCDALINVEASHLYDDPLQFFREALRVLRPGGRLFHADLSWRNIDSGEVMQAAGLEVRLREDITAHVLEALALDTERREQIVSRLPEGMRDDFRNWAGVRGYRAYNRFESGEWVYHRTIAVRPG
jgi:ubiquinone/menaquinone biosynthesis C-methylase UbiE